MERDRTLDLDSSTRWQAAVGVYINHFTDGPPRWTPWRWSPRPPRSGGLRTAGRLEMMVTNGLTAAPGSTRRSGSLGSASPSSPNGPHGASRCALEFDG